MNSESFYVLVQGKYYPGDIEGKRYHWIKGIPGSKQLFDDISEGKKVVFIYYRTWDKEAKKGKYFYGTGKFVNNKIEVEEGKNKIEYFAEISNYKQFDSPVYLHENLRKKIWPGANRSGGIRKISKSLFSRIMETAEISSEPNGGKLYQIRARNTLPILVRQAKAGKKIYYADLANEIDIPNPRNLNYILGYIGTTLKELSKKWNEEIPQIQCIVVNQTTELPGEGIGGFISDTKEFAKLNSKQKKALVDGVLAKIYSYNKWDTVLKALGLQPIPISEEVKKKVKKAASGSGKGGGEGKQHKELKLYIKNNPEIIGIKSKGLISNTEEPLPSGDSVDVFFKNNKNWIGVEVKSNISNELDISRGLFQCVKYHAVMESYLSVLNLERDVRVILALGGEFPKSLVPVKNTLGIEVVEEINRKIGAHIN